MGWLSEWIEGFSSPSQEERERNQKEKEARERSENARKMAKQGETRRHSNELRRGEEREEDEKRSMRTMIAVPQNMLEGFNIDTSEFMNKQPVPVKVNNTLCYGFSEEEFSVLCDFYSFRKSDYSLAQTEYEGVLFVRFNNIPGKKTTENKSSKDTMENTKQKYRALCGHQNIVERKERLKAEIDKLSHSIEEFQQELVSCIRARESKQQQFDTMKEENDKQISEEFDNLLKHPDIEKIAIDGKDIKIYTKEIYITRGSSVYRIGKFEIVLHTDGGAGCVRMFNQTRMFEGAHHPHVNSSGQPCLGNLSETLPYVIGERKYGMAIALCIQYLKSYTNNDNTGRPYATIDNWPRVKNSARADSKRRKNEE